MYSYTYYTEDTTRNTSKLTSRNFRRIFDSQEFILVKINSIEIRWDDNNEQFCITHKSRSKNITECVKEANNRLFNLLSPLELDNAVYAPLGGDCSYLLFNKYYDSDGNVRYRYAITTGIDRHLDVLTEGYFDTRRRHNAVVELEVNDSPKKPIVFAPNKAVKFTLNTECYICMIDFTEDPYVIMNSCCMKLAHAICYSDITNKKSCSCCRTTLD